MNSPLVTLFGREFVQNRQEKSLKTNVFRQIVVEHSGFEPLTSTMRMSNLEKIKTNQSKRKQTIQGFIVHGSKSKPIWINRGCCQICCQNKLYKYK